MDPLSAPEATGEEPASAAVETAEGFVDTAEAAAPLSSWADLSEEATAPTTAVEPEEFGLEPATTSAPLSGGGAASFGAPGEVSDTEELPQFDALSLLTTEAKEESGPVTTEQLQDPAPDVAEGAEPPSEAVDQPIEASESAPLESLVDPKAEVDFEPQEAVVDSAEPELSAAADVPASPDCLKRRKIRLLPLRRF